MHGKAGALEFRAGAPGRVRSTCSTPWSGISDSSMAHDRSAWSWRRGRRARVSGWRRCSATTGSQDIARVDDWAEAQALPAGATALAVLGLEQGFETPDLAVIGEQDILGDRLVRPRKKQRRAADVLTEATSLRRRRSRGACRSRHRPLRGLEDDRGAGRRSRLPRDPLRGWRQAVPAGREHRTAFALRLRRDGRAARPARRRRLAIAQGAAEAAAARDRGRADQDRGAAPAAEAPAVLPPQGAYDEFVARFPYEETEDQEASIDAVLERSRLGPADGPAGVRRCRLRQDGGGAARGVRCGDGGLPGCGRGADDAARAPALQDVHGALQGFAGQDRAGLAPRQHEGAQRRQGGPEERADRHRRRHACAARQADRVCTARAADHRRGAAFRRRAQGAAEAVARGRARADAVGDADPAHAATGADGRARAVADHDAAGRPAGGAHLHLAVRSGHPARCVAARALSRRAELLCRAAHRRSRGGRRVPGRGGAGTARCTRARPADADGARRRHDGVLRRRNTTCCCRRRSSNPASTCRTPTR